jgi:eukaryotic-like serine/threonine-protein kinase
MIDSIGRFEIRRELGRGSQSVVYLAWDPQLEREVAIKTLHLGARDYEHNALFLDEARLVSKLRHPNVVPIYDAGEQDGDLYLVFEYIDGRSLLEMLQAEGSIPKPRAADLMRQVLDAIAKAHALGVIHRDLKPSNILVDSQGTPRVMDFGIASRLPETGREDLDRLVGTPAYMAPEYITDRVVSERMDVFAAGLVLLELVTGKRVFQGGGSAVLLDRIPKEPVTLPRDAGIDDQLGSIILRATAIDPAQRFPTAAEMRQALETYLGMGSEVIVPTGEAEAVHQGTLEFLLRRMRHRTDFPALSDSVSAINRMTHSDRESINKLSNTILKDYALTNKILRMVNSAFYRQVGGGNISTVSRAVIVLGFDTIRNIAITVLLFEHLQDKANARELKESFLRANLAGLLARHAAVKLMPREGEEAFICALFHGLGELLAQYYFPEEVDQIRTLMQSKRLSEDVASAKVLGIPLHELGIGIARTWGFPAAIVNSMRRLPPGPVRKPATRDDTLRMLAGFSNEMCDLIADATPEGRGAAIQAVAERFGGSMHVDDQQLQETVETSFEELTQVASVLRVNLIQSPFARQLKAFTATEAAPAEALTAAAAEDQVPASTVLGGILPEGGTVIAGEEDASEPDLVLPDDAQGVLAAGIQDISNSLVEDFSLNDILYITIETMYRAMGFQRVLLCLKDAKSGQMVGRFGFGADTNEIAPRFRFPLGSATDVFQLAMARSVDIIITDIDDPKIASRVPAWFRQLTTAKTFVLLPLNVKSNPVALIYCDKARAGSIAIPERELALLKTLRNQALLALKQSL